MISILTYQSKSIKSRFFNKKIIKNNENNFKRIFRITLKDVNFYHVLNTTI